MSFYFRGITSHHLVVSPPGRQLSKIWSLQISRLNTFYYFDIFISNSQLFFVYIWVLYGRTLQLCGRATKKCLQYLLLNNHHWCTRWYWIITMPVILLSCRYHFTKPFSNQGGPRGDCCLPLQFLEQQKHNQSLGHFFLSTSWDLCTLDSVIVSL